MHTQSHHATVVAGLALTLAIGAVGCAPAQTSTPTSPSSEQSSDATVVHSYDNDHFGVSVVPPDGYVDVTLSVQAPEVFLFGSQSEIGNTICVSRFELWEKTKAADLHAYAEELATQAKETAQAVTQTEANVGSKQAQIVRTRSIIDSEPRYRDVFLFIDADNTVLQIVLDADSEGDLYTLDAAIQPLS